MEQKRIKYSVDVNAFEKAFIKFVPAPSMQLETDTIYGIIQNHEFTLQKKKEPRGSRSFFDEYLSGRIEGNGEIVYHFRRTLESLALTVFAPLFCLFVSFLGVFVLHVSEFLFALIPGGMFALCNLIRPKKLREDLLDVLLRVADAASSAPTST